MHEKTKEILEKIETIKDDLLKSTEVALALKPTKPRAMCVAIISDADYKILCKTKLYSLKKAVISMKGKIMGVAVCAVAPAGIVGTRELIYSDIIGIQHIRILFRVVNIAESLGKNVSDVLFVAAVTPWKAVIMIVKRKDLRKIYEFFDKLSIDAILTLGIEFYEKMINDLKRRKVIEYEVMKLVPASGRA